MPNLTFWEKWNAIAKTKGFSDLEDMLKNYQEKHTNKEIANLLDVSPRTIEMMWVKLGANKSQRDGDGFNKTDAKQRWMKILSEKGFGNLREAGEHYKSKNLPLSKMAEDFGVSVKSLKTRLENANIFFPKEEVKAVTLNPLGLL